MGRAPCCDKANVKKGPWSPEEDAKLKEYIEKHGTGGNWIALPQKAGLKRCGKSCRLRWLNYLRPNIKHGEFSEDEDRIICCLFASIGSRWSIIASQLPGRTDNDIKNYWNTKLKKKMMGMDPPVLKKPHQVIPVSILQNSTPSSSSPRPSSFSNNSYYHPPHVSFTSHESISYSSSLIVGGTSSNSADSIFQSQEETFVDNNTFQNYQVVKDGESISYSSSLIMGGTSSNSADSIFQSQEETFVDNNTIQNYRVVKDGVLLFVKESELGSCGDGLLCDGTFVDHIGANAYPYNGVEDTQKLMLFNASRGSERSEEQRSNVLGENPLDYGLEEIKQLISTSSCNNFLFDENTTEERVMYI